MRRAFTLLEVVIATLVLATLGLAIFELGVASTRGVASDRFVEAQTGLVQDLLEMLCQPYTSLPALFPEAREPGKAISRVFTIDEVLELVKVPASVAPTLKATLLAGKLEGFTIAWKPRLDAGRGSAPDALRLDYVQVTAVLASDSPGPREESFRVFAVRGQLGE